MPLDARLRRTRRSTTSAPRSASTPSTPPPASTRSSTRTWPPPPACTPSSRASTCAASRCSLRRRRARCTPAAWPSCSSPTASCSRSTPACCRRSARWCRRCASTSPARWPRRLDAIDPAERDALLDDLRAEGRRVLGAAGAPADGDPVPLRARRPLHGAGQRGHGVGGRRDRPGRPTTPACSRAFEAEYRRIYGLTIPDVGIEVVTWRLSAVADAVRRRARSSSPAGEPAPTPAASRPVVFGAERRPSTRRSTNAHRPRRRRDDSTGRRSSRNARRPRSSARAGPSRSAPTAASSPTRANCRERFGPRPQQACTRASASEHERSEPS